MFHSISVGYQLTIPHVYEL